MTPAGLQVFEKAGERGEAMAAAARDLAFVELGVEGEDFDGVEAHEADVAEGRGEAQGVVELASRHADADVSSSMRTGTRGSIWNILRNILSRRM